MRLRRYNDALTTIDNFLQYAASHTKEVEDECSNSSSTIEVGKLLLQGQRTDIINIMQLKLLQVQHHMQLEHKELTLQQQQQLQKHQQESDAKAVEICKLVLALEPNNYNANFRIGTYWLGKSKPDEAVPYMTLASQHCPHSPYVYTLRLLPELKLLFFPIFKKQLYRCLPLMHLGNCYRVSNPTQAIEYYEQAFNANPTCHDAIVAKAMGSLLQLQKKPNEAIDFMISVMSKHNNSTTLNRYSLLVRLALVCVQERKFMRANEYLEQAIDIDPHYPEAYDYLFFARRQELFQYMFMSITKFNEEAAAANNNNATATTTAFPALLAQSEIEFEKLPIEVQQEAMRKLNNAIEGAYNRGIENMIRSDDLIDLINSKQRNTRYDTIKPLLRCNITKECFAKHLKDSCPENVTWCENKYKQRFKKLLWNAREKLTEQSVVTQGKLLVTIVCEQFKKETSE